MSWWKTTRAKYEALIAEYGAIAFTVYFSIFFLTLAGFFFAIQRGLEVDAAAGHVGTLGGAYAATKLTQPVRILATLALTPIAAKTKHLIWPKAEPSE